MCSYHSLLDESSSESLTERYVFDMWTDLKKYLLSEGTNLHHTPFTVGHCHLWPLKRSNFFLLCLFFLICKVLPGCASEGKAQKQCEKGAESPCWLWFFNKGWQIATFFHVDTRISFYFTWNVWKLTFCFFGGESKRIFF